MAAPKPAIRQPAGRPNTVGLHTRELGVLLDALDLPDRTAPTANRSFVRWPFRSHAVPLQVLQPGGSVAGLTVACRNISRGGMSVLHSSFMHTGTRVVVGLPLPTSGERPIDGWVVRCHHRSGLIHEIGIAFAEPVDLRELLHPDPFSPLFSLERVRPEDLKGSLLYLSDSEVDARIVKHFLRGSELSVRTAASTADAIAMLGEHLDLIVCEFNLPDGSCADFVAAVREHGSPVPVIIVTSDTSAEARRELSEIRAAALIAKPLSQDRFLQALAEFLIVRGDTGSAVSSLPADDPAATLVEAFVTALKGHAKRLEESVRRDDAKACRALCLRIGGTAPTLGFQLLAALCNRAADRLAATMSVPASLHAVRPVISACERAKARAAA